MLAPEIILQPSLAGEFVDFEKRVKSEQSHAVDLPKPLYKVSRKNEPTLRRELPKIQKWILGKTQMPKRRALKLEPQSPFLPVA